MSEPLVMYYWSADDGKVKHTLGYFEANETGEIAATEQFDRLKPDEPRLITIYRSGDTSSLAYLSHVRGHSLWEYGFDFRYDFPN